MKQNRCFSQFPAGPFILVLASLLPATAGAAGHAPQATNTITINRTRHYDLSPTTLLTLDGRPISAAQLQQLGNGFSTQVRVINAPDGLAGGDAIAVDLRTLARGPVTATNPLQVLNQPVSTNADTVLVGLPGGVDAVAVGDLLQISGYLDSNGSIVASRLQGALNPTTDWKLAGRVSSLNGTQFSIGGQRVDYGSVVPTDCGPALQDGQLVELESLRNPAYTPAATLIDVIAVACEDWGIDDPPGGAVSVEGVVSQLPDPPTSPPSFQLGAITVHSTAQTEYRGGTAEDIDEGVRLEAEGIYDAAQSTLLAREIRFVQAQVRFRAPLQPADITPGEQLDVLNSVVQFSPQTRDEDAIAANGLTAPRQVEVIGFVDRDGGLFATRLRDRGNPDAQRIVLSGPVASIAAPNLTILGQVVDTTGAVFRDAANQPISAAAFFAQIRAGSIVKASEARVDTATQRLRALEMELEDDGVPTAAERAAAGGQNGVALGTVSAVAADLIFAGNFQ
ncbi:MAG: hypothetical protein JNN30_06655 [Rhodanobacteraceae bacterium]|nr:hypothetical protein [Rhodanobacteraceae bacterium]